MKMYNGEVIEKSKIESEVIKSIWKRIAESKAKEINCMTCKAEQCELCNGSEYYEEVGE